MTTTQFSRISRALIVAINDAIKGSHAEKVALFESAGACDPEPSPDASHAARYKSWMLLTGKEQSIDNYQFVGELIEEFMDVPHPGWLFAPEAFERSPNPEVVEYGRARKALEEALEADGLQYFRGGRIIPVGSAPDPIMTGTRPPVVPLSPSTVDQVILTVLKGLRRAMSPLSQRRKGATALAFANEYDVQDLLHALLRPWVADIRPEEYTPSYASKSTRMDFLLPAHAIVIEVKLVRDAAHAKKIGEELTIDIAAYAAHPDCQQLWCVVYDPNGLIQNPDGLVADLDGEHTRNGRRISVKTLIF